MSWHLEPCAVAIRFTAFVSSTQDIFWRRRQDFLADISNFTEFASKHCLVVQTWLT
eukprot:CAMPEP_0115145748 /NCGR_PEP_ID=MMETSP0227-20121206/62306_1 /TAXON_ID=89957 /ORGANISM="Polarella glacialis, Strain CCMP 1383" /LENGTH=55 /DNA_ID=CAMNT_0002555337 /DNA_START=609 /DNA_END=776 /DNA_ORIENTATION=-